MNLLLEIPIVLFYLSIICWVIINMEDDQEEG
jgi:hypothetical protein